MRKTKGLLKTLVMAFLSLIIGFSLPIMVFAGTATSSTQYYTVYGYDYTNFSIVTTGLADVQYANSCSVAQTPKAGTRVPAGYMGAKARLFNSSNTLVAVTNYIYNSASTATQSSDFASLEPAISGQSYYGYGITAAYNGNGYTTYYTNTSPSQTAP